MSRFRNNKGFSAEEKTVVFNDDSWITEDSHIYGEFNIESGSVGRFFCQ